MQEALLKVYYRANLAAGKNSISVNAADLPSGIYICRLHVEGQSDEVIKFPVLNNKAMNNILKIIILSAGISSNASAQQDPQYAWLQVWIPKPQVLSVLLVQWQIRKVMW